MPEDTRGVTREFPQAPRDTALRSPPIREAESAIGVLRNALGMCKSEGLKSESAIGVVGIEWLELSGLIEWFELIGLN